MMAIHPRNRATRNTSDRPRRCSAPPGHHKVWLLACRTGSPTRSNFDFAGPLTEAVLLGMVRLRNGGDPLQWDSANLKVTNDPDANRFLHYDYRAGFHNDWDCGRPDDGESELVVRHAKVGTAGLCPRIPQQGWPTAKGWAPARGSGQVIHGCGAVVLESIRSDNGAFPWKWSAVR
jgi:hypothetical protein